MVEFKNLVSTDGNAISALSVAATYLLRHVLPVRLTEIILSYRAVVRLIRPCAVVPRGAFFNDVLERVLTKVGFWKVPVFLR